MTGDIIVDQKPKNHVQRLVLADVFGALSNDGTDLRLWDHRPPFGINNNVLARANHARRWLEEKVGNAGVFMGVLHQLFVIKGHV